MAKRIKLEQTLTELENQIDILQKKLMLTPEKNGVKYNPKYFAIRGKIKKLQQELPKKKLEEHLAR